MDKKIKKGMYGYRDAHKKRQILLVSLFLLVIAGPPGLPVFYHLEVFKKPGDHQCHFNGAPHGEPGVAPGGLLEDPDRPQRALCACPPYGEKFPMLYDLIITSRDFIMPVDVAVIHPTRRVPLLPKEGDRYQGGGEVFKRDADRMEVRRKRQDHDGKEKFPYPAFHPEKCH